MIIRFETRHNQSSTMAWASQEGQAFIPQENEELDEGAGDGLGEGGTPGQNHRAELMDILIERNSG